MSTFELPLSYPQLVDRATKSKVSMVLTVHPGGSWTCVPISEEIMQSDDPELAGRLWAVQQKRIHDEVTKT